MSADALRIRKNAFTGDVAINLIPGDPFPWAIITGDNIITGIDPASVFTDEWYEMVVGKDYPQSTRVGQYAMIVSTSGPYNLRSDEELSEWRDVDG